MKVVLTNADVVPASVQVGREVGGSLGLAGGFTSTGASKFCRLTRALAHRASDSSTRNASRSKSTATCTRALCRLPSFSGRPVWSAGISRSQVLTRFLPDSLPGAFGRAGTSSNVGAVGGDAPEHSRSRAASTKSHRRRTPFAFVRGRPACARSRTDGNRSAHRHTGPRHTAGTGAGEGAGSYFRGSHS